MNIVTYCPHCEAEIVYDEGQFPGMAELRAESEQLKADRDALRVGVALRDAEIVALHQANENVQRELVREKARNERLAKAAVSTRDWFREFAPTTAGTELAALEAALTALAAEPEAGKPASEKGAADA